MNNLRLFIAFDISPKIIKDLSKAIEELKKYKADIKWVGLKNYHLTLIFLGDIAKENLPEIKGIINETASKYKKVKVRLKKQLGYFGSPEKPKVLWLGFDDKDSKLMKIHKALASRLRACGYKIEDRKFTPHLTLGRFRTSKNSHFLIDNIILENLSEALINFNALALYKSQLSAEGAIHTKLLSAQLNN